MSLLKGSRGQNELPFIAFVKNVTLYVYTHIFIYNNSPYILSIFKILFFIH